ncbi:MAG: SufE family protein [Opitutales bacterium]
MTNPETAQDLKTRKEKLVETLSLFPDPQERLTYILEQARSMPALENSLKVKEFIVEGCQSQLWLVPRFEAGRCHYATDSDAVITKGIAGLLTELYSGAEPGEILANEPDFLAEVGITQHLTPNRRNGLSNVWKKIQSFASACAEETTRN